MSFNIFYIFHAFTNDSAWLYIRLNRTTWVQPFLTSMRKQHPPSFSSPSSAVICASFPHPFKTSLLVHPVVLDRSWPLLRPLPRSFVLRFLTLSRPHYSFNPWCWIDHDRFLLFCINAISLWRPSGVCEINARPHTDDRCHSAPFTPQIQCWAGPRGTSPAAK